MGKRIADGGERVPARLDRISRMTSVAEKTRKIAVGGTPFGWRVTHRHRIAPTGRRCLHEFLAYRIGTSRAPFRLSFQGPSADAAYDRGADYTLDHGGLWIGASSTMINLHRPATAAAGPRANCRHRLRATARLTPKKGGR